MLTGSWEELVAEERLEELNRRIVEASEETNARRARRDEPRRLLEVGQNPVQNEKTERLVA